MKFKKLASLVLTGAMIASMSMSAFAFGGGVTPASNNNAGNSAASGSSSSSATGATVPVGSSVQTATIKVTVATATNVIINPYQMVVTMPTGDKQDRFLSTPVVATNESTTKVDVTARVTVTASGEVKIVDDITNVQTPPTDDPGDKNMYVALLVANVDTTDAPELEVTDLGKSDQAVKLGSTALTVKEDYKMIPIAASGTEVGYGSTGDEDETALTLEAGDTTTNYFAMQLFGEVNNRTANAWTENDTISASIVLTFKAQPLNVPNS